MPDNIKTSQNLTFREFQLRESLQPDKVAVAGGEVSKELVRDMQLATQRIEMIVRALLKGFEAYPTLRERLVFVDRRIVQIYRHLSLQPDDGTEEVAHCILQISILHQLRTWLMGSAYAAYALTSLTRISHPKLVLLLSELLPSGDATSLADEIMPNHSVETADDNGNSNEQNE